MLICRYEPAIGLSRFGLWLLVRAMVQIRPGSGAEPRCLGSSPTSSVFCFQMQKPDSSCYTGYTTITPAGNWKQRPQPGSAAPAQAHDTQDYRAIPNGF